MTKKNTLKSLVQWTFHCWLVNIYSLETIAMVTIRSNSLALDFYQENVENDSVFYGQLLSMGFEFLMSHWINNEP